ncbi:MAG: DegV family EDD domain-containing protein [Syntrophobacterales bacterium]|jgi:DegV family protein with EDD domain|nr:DegV family EDD domain-containing protein [Syntrophobacterales bacterium]
MSNTFRYALSAGYAHLAAWGDLLDRINVFPVADGDTGRNLIVTLSPLRHQERSIDSTIHDLLFQARGNSGNIASAFFQDFVRKGEQAFLEAVLRGRDCAWSAVPDPRPGTMLTFFDALADACRLTWNQETINDRLSCLAETVRRTVDQQDKLRQAGVVDAGALGMYLFFEGFFPVFLNANFSVSSMREKFGDFIQIDASYQGNMDHGYCIDAVYKGDLQKPDNFFSSLGESVITYREGDCLKVHFHTQDKDNARRRLASAGEVIYWSEDDLYAQTKEFNSPVRQGPIHIMTDAAGSLTRTEAKRKNITLLDSYIHINDLGFPETCLAADDLYKAMRTGIRVSTAQASRMERFCCYQRVMESHERVLYLCVGSVYTGNYQTVLDWKKDYDPQDRMTVIDTGAASGRLAVLALAAALFAEQASSPQEVIDFSQGAVDRAEECIFLDKLEYLAAGGRITKTGAFLGDLLGMKPVVTPAADGARKVGLCRARRDQEKFALKFLADKLKKDEKALILLEYSDNAPELEELLRTLQTKYPESHVMFVPLSLTSGAHMGPGTWAVAFLPL